MAKGELAARARALRDQANEVKRGGPVALTMKGPHLVEETARLLVDLAERLDALTPYLDEGEAD